MPFPRCQHFVRFFMIILIFPSFDRNIPVRIELCSQTLFCSATFFSSERFCGRLLRGDPFYPLLYTAFRPTSKISVKIFLAFQTVPTTRSVFFLFLDFCFFLAFLEQFMLFFRSFFLQKIRKCILGYKIIRYLYIVVHLFIRPQDIVVYVKIFNFRIM